MDKLIIALTTAYAKDGVLDKEATSHNDLSNNIGLPTGTFCLLSKT
jgi:hypothetical protein